MFKIDGSSLVELAKFGLIGVTVIIIITTSIIIINFYRKTDHSHTNAGPMYAFLAFSFLSLVLFSFMFAPYIIIKYDISQISNSIKEIRKYSANEVGGDYSGHNAFYVRFENCFHTSPMNADVNGGCKSNETFAEQEGQIIDNQAKFISDEISHMKFILRLYGLESDYVDKS